MTRILLGPALLASLLVLAAPAVAQEKTPVPVLLDTDLGDDVDDAFALALVLASPELDLRGVTTVGGDAHTRALIACRFLAAVGRADVPVAAGRPPQDPPATAGQFQYGLRPVHGRRPERGTAVDFLYRQLRARPGELTLLAVGPLTNVAALFERHPDCKPWVRRVVVMGGAVRVGYDGKGRPEPEWNVAQDVKAARAVFAAGVPLTVVPLDATAGLALDGPALRRVWQRRSVLTDQLYALHRLWGKPTPVLFDPAAVALAFSDEFFTLEDLALAVDDKGLTSIAAGKPTARVATAVRRDAFLRWAADRLAAAPFPAAGRGVFANPVRPVPRGPLPARVHVVEDYETDIERRWWLAGLPEKDGAIGRACRGVPCDDFDDRQGDPRAQYTAVIFNPVPGPPMGPRTRLAFRCRLRGTDTLKVQIYSLSNGYHRHLTLTGLAADTWHTQTVDMTQARRPAGRGGPLAEGERIDDVQFYAARDADLWIDDVVLYDAADDEKRPFSRPIFTAWFDTGRQGAEWPGTFDIVAKPKPATGRAAKSVALPGGPGLRVGLRGDRPLGPAPHLRFRYFLTHADRLTVALAHRKDGVQAEKTLTRLRPGEWAEAEVDFGAMPAVARADEIHFTLPGGEVLIDDVLLYEPGR